LASYRQIVYRTQKPGCYAIGSAFGNVVRSALFQKSEKGLCLPQGTASLYLLVDHIDNISYLSQHLEAGHVVICDRYTDSAFAYNVVKEPPVPNEILNLWKQFAGPTPDITFLLVAQDDKGQGIGWALDRARERDGASGKQRGKRWNDYDRQRLIQQEYIRLLKDEDRTVLVPVRKQDSSRDIHDKILQTVSEKLTVGAAETLEFA
jgi:thymidylate kinase